MTRDEEKGYLFYIYRVNKNAYNYEPVDPKYYPDDELNRFAKMYALDEILYETEAEAQQEVDRLNDGLCTTLSFDKDKVACKEGIAIIDGCSTFTVTFPTGKTATVTFDPVYEIVRVKENREN